METKTFIISTLIFSLLSNSSILIIAQINTPCSPTMLSSATGCMNFLTGNGNNNSPDRDCCEALKSLTGTGLDCLCLIVTANVPINLPINRTLAISLPRACGMNGVPVKCKASAAPLPAPGPVSLGPTTFPTGTQTPEGPGSYSPATSPTPSQDPSGSGLPDFDMGDRDRTGMSKPKPSAALPSSSHSLKLLIILFALAINIISF